MKQIILLMLFFTFEVHLWSQSKGSEILYESNQSNFLENKGQYADRQGEQRVDVLFKSSNSNVYIRENGMTYLLVDNGDYQMKPIHRMVDDWIEDPEMPSVLEKPLSWSIHQIDLIYEGMNKNIRVLKKNKSSDYSNFYGASCPEGVLNVFGYESVVYQNLYDQIDVEYFFHENEQLKYNYNIYPGGTPKDIRMIWKGADSVKILPNGQLAIYNQIQTLFEEMPRVYQLFEGDTVDVACRYVYDKRKKNGIMFEVADYNKGYTLIIDPWVTNYGGDMDEFGVDVTTDLDGNIFISGETSSEIAIGDAGFSDTYIGGGSDSFLAKFDVEGNRIWGTYYGGSSGDREEGASIAADSEGNVYMGGSTQSSDGIHELGFQADFGGVYDAYLVKFAPTGERIWGTYYGGAGEEYGYGVTVDQDDNAYLAGMTASEVDITEGGHQNEFGGFVDAFLVKFSPSGDRMWCTYYGGLYADIFHDLAVDQDNNIIGCGITTSNDQIGTPGVFQEENEGAQEAFLVKFTEDGTRLWGTYMGSLWVERGDAVAVDNEDNIYMVGKTTAPDLTSSSGAFQEENGGISDAFLIKFSPVGERLWSTYIGGELIDYAFGVAVDPISNDVLVAGETYSPDFPVWFCAEQAGIEGTLNAFVTRFFPDGTLYCSSYFGIEEEAESSIYLHGCEVYVVGTTEGNISTIGAHQTLNGGGKDAFLAQLRISSCGMDYPLPELTSLSTDEEDVTSCTPCNGFATIDLSSFCIPPNALKSYVWSNGVEELNTTNVSSTIDGICEGEYSVIVTINCDQIDTFYFDLGNTASITADFEGEDVCIGDPISFTNNSFTVFGEIVSNEWTFGDGELIDAENPSHTYDEPGMYEVWLKVTNDSNCEDSISFPVTVHPAYDIDIDTTVCSNQEYVFPDGTILSPLADTLVTYSGETIFGCDSNIVIQVTVLESSYEEVEILADEGELITFPDGLIIPVYSDTAVTTVLLNEAGCDSIILTTVEVNEVIDSVFPPPIPVTKIIVPNIFSPDQDGANSGFFFPQGQDVLSFNCVIMNRWGKKVFEFSDITDTWFGINQSNGLPCAQGTYFYTYKGAYINGELFSGQGTVQLVRKE